MMKNFAQVCGALSLYPPSKSPNLSPILWPNQAAFGTTHCLNGCKLLTLNQGLVSPQRIAWMDVNCFTLNQGHVAFLRIFSENMEKEPRTKRLSYLGEIFSNTNNI
ncbi:hypothetical protein AMTRI_Chr04g184120 [Amborella trichopoda]